MRKYILFVCAIILFICINDFVLNIKQGTIHNEVFLQTLLIIVWIIWLMISLIIKSFKLTPNKINFSNNKRANKIFNEAWILDSTWDFERIKKFVIQSFLKYNESLSKKDSSFIKPYSNIKFLRKIDKIILKKLNSNSYFVDNISIKYLSIMSAKDIEWMNGDKVTIVTTVLMVRFIEDEKWNIKNPIVQLRSNEDIHNYTSRIQTNFWEYDISFVLEKHAWVWLINDIKDWFIDKL